MSWFSFRFEASEAFFPGTIASCVTSFNSSYTFNTRISHEKLLKYGEAKGAWGDKETGNLFVRKNPSLCSIPSKNPKYTGKC